MKQPPLGWTTIVTNPIVTDGDTIKVKIEKEIEIRITDDLENFNTPEISKAKTKEEKARGLEAKKYLEEVLSKATKIVVYIPTDEKGRIKDLFTLSRIVGRVFVDGTDVTELMKDFNVGLKKKK